MMISNNVSALHRNLYRIKRRKEEISQSSRQKNISYNKDKGSYNDKNEISRQRTTMGECTFISYIYFVLFASRYVAAESMSSCKQK